MAAPARKLKASGCKVFFDFDHTITRADVLDEIITRFSVGEDWVALEEAWQAGAIGSRECLEGQMRSIRATRQALAAYLKGVEIDPAFAQLLDFLKQKRVPCEILSDSFSFIIKTILRHYGMSRIRVSSNHLAFEGDRLIPSFPYEDETCSRKCAHCKKIHLVKSGGKTLLYVGDGLSDICAAEKADLVFAKGSLLDYLRKAKKPCYAFKNLNDVYRKMKELLDDQDGEDEKNFNRRRGRRTAEVGSKVLLVG